MSRAAVLAVVFGRQMEPAVLHGNGAEADDKVIAVLDNDYVYGMAEDIKDLPAVLVERLHHYFETYKLVPDRPTSVTIERVYGRAHGLKVVEAAIADYAAHFSVAG